MVVPDTGAQMNWLKNRKPDEWRDKQIIEHEAGEGLVDALQEKTSQEILEELRKRGL